MSGCDKEPAEVVVTIFPTITEFEVTPNSIYPEDEIFISWDGTGTSGELKQIEVETGLIVKNIRVSVKGSTTVKLTKTTKFTFQMISGDFRTVPPREKTVIVNPLPDPPTITVTAPTEQLPYYSSTSFTWSVTGEFTNITLNNVTIGENGTFETPKLTGDSTFILKAIGPGGTTTEEIKILVGDWTTSPIGLLTKKIWHTNLLERKMYVPENPWYIPYVLSPEQKAETWDYTLDGKEIHGNKENGFPASSENYELLNDNEELSLYFPDQNKTYPINVLTKDSLRFDIKGEGINTLDGSTYSFWTRVTYVH